MIGNFLDEDDAIDLAESRPTKIWAPEVAYLERRAKIILEIGIGGFRLAPTASETTHAGEFWDRESRRKRM